jgi:Domain of unknown function (DUF3846)
MKFYIKTDSGFFKDKGFQDDHILNAFVYSKSDARFFEDAEDAKLVLYALFMEGIKGQILAEERQMDNDKALYQAARKAAAEAAEMINEHPSAEVIQIVVVEPNRTPYKKLIPNTLEAFNKIVCGHMEHLYIGEIKKGVRLGLIINEEGKLLQLPFNRKIIDVDTVVGTFFITAYNVLGENISLTDQEADFLIKRFRNLEVKV